MLDRTGSEMLPAHDGMSVTKTRVRTGPTLRAKRQRLAGIIEGANLGTWEWNVQTGAVVLNERWAAIVGYTLAELAPVSIETWRTLTHPDDLQASAALLARHFRGELASFWCEARMRHKDGSWVWVLDQGKVTQWTAEGKPLLMHGGHTDITVRKQTEAALRISEEKFAQAFRSGPDGFILSSVPDGRITEVNDTVTRMSGYAPEKLLGKTTVELGLWAEPEARDRYAATVRREGRVTNFEAVFRAKSGKLHTCLISTEIIQLQTGPHFLNVLRDVTERHQTQERSRRLRDLGLAVVAVSDLNEAMRLCLQAAIDISGLDCGGIYLVSESSGDLNLACQLGLSAAFLASSSHFAADSANARWAREGKSAHGNVATLGMSPLAAEREAQMNLYVNVCH